jgi:hypothetical protein
MTDEERYARARQAVAVVLYARNRFAGELAAMQRDGARRDELARTARALAELQQEAEEAIAALVALRESMRARAREELLARVTELSIQREVDQLVE